MALGALIVVCIYIAGFSLSWGPVVWVMLAEIFPNSIRDKAMAIAVAAQWFMNWVVTVTFNIMDGNSALTAAFNHGFAYWLYGGFSVLAALFVWKFVPESKGMSLENMQKLWKTQDGRNYMIEHLPSDWRQAILVGRLLTREGPTPVVVVEGRVRDVSRHAATVSQLLNGWNGRCPGRAARTWVRSSPSASRALFPPIRRGTGRAPALAFRPAVHQGERRHVRDLGHGARDRRALPRRCEQGRQPARSLRERIGADIRSVKPGSEDSEEAQGTR